MLLSNRSEYDAPDCVTETAFVIHSLHKHKHDVVVADTLKYHVYVPGQSLDHGLKAGDLIVEGSIMHQAVTRKQRIRVYKDSSLFGYPYISIAFPVLEHDTVLGGLIICENIVQERPCLQEQSLFLHWP